MKNPEKTQPKRYDEAFKNNRRETPAGKRQTLAALAPAIKSLQADNRSFQQML